MHAYVNSCLHWGMHGLQRDVTYAICVLIVLLNQFDASIVVIHYVNFLTHTHAVPPSRPLNVRVVDMSSTTLTLAWDEPVSTGGRSRDELRYNLWFRVVGETNITLSSTVTTTMGLIGGKQLLQVLVNDRILCSTQYNITSPPPPPPTHTHTYRTIPKYGVHSVCNIRDGYNRSDLRGGGVHSGQRGYTCSNGCCDCTKIYNCPSKL